MVNLCIVNEDHPRCNVSRKAIKACPGRGWPSLGLSLALSHLESGHAIPFSPQDFCSPCVFVCCSHNTGSCRPGSATNDLIRWGCNPLKPPSLGEDTRDVQKRRKCHVKTGQEGGQHQVKDNGLRRKHPCQTLFLAFQPLDL